MPVKKPPDLSRFLLSPMPGLLASLAVATGQEVKAGQELCRRRGDEDGEPAACGARRPRRRKLHAKPGDSLAVDQPILEFE